MKRIKIEVEVDITDHEEYCDIVDTIESALDEEYSIYETKLIAIEQV